MKVAVGCPIKNRAWIFPQWEEHVRNAFEVAGLKPHWMFAIGLDPTGSDDGTHRLVTELYRNEPGWWTEINEPVTPSYRTSWTRERLTDMARYRNQLLALVRAYQPDFFLSVDSDILLHPCALISLLETQQKRKWDAVGGKAFLSEVSRHLTTYGELNPAGGMNRQDQSGVFSVQVIMALKLMNPAAYNVDYEFHRIGEDIGWSLNCAKAGVTLGWDGRIISKHVMQPERLNKVDPRVGW